MRQNSFIKWIINHFAYRQIFVILALFFLFSTFPITLYWVDTHEKRLHLVEDQLDTLHVSVILKNLLIELQQHRDLSHDYLNGNKHVYNELQILQTQIDENIKIIVDWSQDPVQIAKVKSEYEAAIWQKVNPLNIQNEWETLIQEFKTVTPEQSDYLHRKIIKILLVQFQYLNARLGITNYQEIDNFLFIETIFVRLAPLQENLSRLMLITKNNWNGPIKSDQKIKIQNLTDAISYDVDFLDYGIDFEKEKPESKRPQIYKLLVEYLKSVRIFLNNAKIHFLNQDELVIPLSLSDYLEEAALAIKNGYDLWNAQLNELFTIFQKEQKELDFQVLTAPMLNLLLKLFTFLIAFFLIVKGTSRLTELTKATRAFTNGNLSVRVPEVYEDEIGLQGQAFNQMAQKLEEIIKHLYELLDATSALANGNLAARIPLKKDQSGFDEVAQSFNQMASNFETIIGRLQQVGLILTTSANEVAGASKEQETLILKQEATTREISSAANEISATSKELANTMNELNQVTEETSMLAIHGKDSLSNMESIMSHMVDASSNIASRLALLNEKVNNITGVVTTITKVADQTNLLSLNASIEAEKAGEFGRSFAVIAREIRRLADQSAIATLDIEKIVNEILSAVSSSVTGVDDFTQEIRKGVEQVKTVSEQLGSIIEQVEAFTNRFDLVNQGMQAQSEVAEQINEAIAQLTYTAQQTNQAIHQFHNTIEELNSAANGLKILDPFSKSEYKKSGEYLQSLTGESTIKSSEPTSTESFHQFDKSLKSLNTAANKLKNLKSNTDL